MSRNIRSILIHRLQRIHSKYDFTRGAQYPAICRDTVNRDPKCLQYFNNDLRTAEICKVAIENDPMTIRFVPKEILLENPELCLLAADRNHRALYFVPREFLRFE